MKSSDSDQREFYFDDYYNTKVVYHIAPITKLGDILKKGLNLNESTSRRYTEFNIYFDKLRPPNIPDWVSRGNAVYGSMNFKSNHKWHSHSVILALRIDEDKCWIGNENMANALYEPYILKNIEGFESADRFVEARGEEYALNYWSSSMAFGENLKIRVDKTAEYDAEVLIMHDIPPKDIKIARIISDHKIMDSKGWNRIFNEV